MTSFTKIDWFSCRTTAQVPEVLEAIANGFGDHSGMVETRQRPGGWQGYEQSRTVTVGGQHVGIMAYGGSNQRGWVSINLSGQGCAWVDDWKATEDVYSSLRAYEARRVDIALDTYQREVTHDTVVEAYREGQFSVTNHTPAMRLILNEDRYDGQTVYVGKRQSGKFFRGYEKGYELASKNPGLRVTHIDEIPIEDFYRLEIELKAKEGPLPTDLIAQRDNYFSGAYPYLQSVLDAEPKTYSQSREKAIQRTVEETMAQIRLQYGPSLYTLLQAFDGDVLSLFKKICGSKHNDDLVAAGALLYQK